MASLKGSARKDLLTGGAGNDTLAGLAGNDVLRGGAGADRLSGGAGNDQLFGGAGSDNLTGEAGNDLLDGGAGADRMAGGVGNDTYRVDHAGDRVVDSAGIDRLTAVVNAVLGTGVERGTLLGSAALKLTGNGQDNVLRGNVGNNLLDGRAGNDTLMGGAGDDVLRGGAGVDVYQGGDGSDTVDYSTDTSGFAVLIDLSGVQTALGAAAGESFDSIENLIGTEVSGAGDVLTGNDGANTLAGGAGDDQLRGLLGDDILRGGDGDDFFFSDDAGDGADIYDGGAGSDTVSFQGLLGRVFVDLLATDTATGAVGGIEVNDRLIGIENLIGGDHLDGDELFGNGADNVLSGRGGEDSIDGRAGADTLFGGAGDDFLEPGNDDALDTVNGGDGLDTVSYQDAGAGVLLVVISGGGNAGLPNSIGSDTLLNIEHVIGSAHNDTLFVGATLAYNALVNGGAGDDVLDASALVTGAIEILTGGSGRDQFSLHPLSNAHITDYLSPIAGGDTDLLRFSSSELGGMNAGNLAIFNRSNNVATTAGAQFIYDTSTHTLWFDADGAGGTGPATIASFGGSFASGLNSLGSSDFLFVA